MADKKSHKQSEKQHAAPKKAEHKKSEELELTLNKTVLAAAIVILLAGLVIFLYMNTVPASERSSTLVTVNNEKISTKDFEFLYSQLPAQQAMEISKREFLNITISELLLLQRATKLNLGATPAEAEKYVGDVLAQANMDPAVFWERATANGATKEQIILLARNRLMLTRLLEAEVYPKLNVSNEDAEQFYNNSPGLFAQPESVRASHILVKTESEAKALIAQLGKAKNLSATFAQIAIEKSLDPGSGSRGGDLGDFPRGMMVPTFEEAAFKLKEGTYTKTPIKSDFGYHIIYVTSKKPAMQLSFEESKDRIVRTLFAQQAEQATQEYAAFLRSKSKIVLNEAEVAKLGNANPSSMTGAVVADSVAMPESVAAE